MSPYLRAWLAAWWRRHWVDAEPEPVVYGGGSVRAGLPQGESGFLEAEHWVTATYPHENGNVELWAHSEADLAEMVTLVAMVDHQ